jgi:glutamine cyclotransferase
MSELIERVIYNPAIDLLNGIAYDKSEDVFYLTGKLWPKLFKVKLGS